MQILNDIKPLHPLIQEVAQGSFRHKQLPAIQGSGWVVKSLEAALWAFHDADGFEEAVLRSTTLGEMILVTTTADRQRTVVSAPDAESFNETIRRIRGP